MHRMPRVAYGCRQGAGKLEELEIPSSLVHALLTTCVTLRLHPRFWGGGTRQHRSAYLCGENVSSSRSLPSTALDASAVHLCRRLRMTRLERIASLGFRFRAKTWDTPPVPTLDLELYDNEWERYWIISRRYESDSKMQLSCEPSDPC